HLGDLNHSEFPCFPCSARNEPRVTRAGQSRYHAYHDPRDTGTRKGENVNEKQHWTGIAPSARVLAQLDYEEMAVLALLSWSTAANRPVTSLDVASLADRDGSPLGLAEAREIVQHLGDMKVVSVFGMGNERPMSVRVGGFQPRTPKKFDDRRPSAPRASFAPRSLPAPRRTDSQPRKSAMRKSAMRKPGGTPPWVLKERR